MHEHSLIADLMRKITAVAHERNARRVVSVQIRLGALSHISASHFTEHFVEAAKGTVAEGARLVLTSVDDITDPHAQDILLENLEIEE